MREDTPETRNAPLRAAGALTARKKTLWWPWAAAARPLLLAGQMLALALALAMVLTACTSAPESPSASADPVYRCEQGVEFSAQLSDDAAVLKGRWGQALLLRDAGGLQPGQRVFSNQEMRAEFGLGANAREAVLHELVPEVAQSAPRSLRCQLQ